MLERSLKTELYSVRNVRKKNREFLLEMLERSLKTELYSSMQPDVSRVTKLRICSLCSCIMQNMGPNIKIQGHLYIYVIYAVHVEALGLWLWLWLFEALAMGHFLELVS